MKPRVHPLALLVAASVAVAAAATVSVAGATRVEAQTREGWHFVGDPLTDLWYHGLAVIGFDGTGRLPLHAEGYARAARLRWADAGAGASALERARPELLAAFRADPAFEVLHFVPLYFTDAPVDVALSALGALGDSRASHLDPRITREATAIGGVLATPEQRAALATFVQALAEDRKALVHHGLLGTQDGRRLATAWKELSLGPFADFLADEGIEMGTVFVAQALGREGRFLQAGGTVRVVVGATPDEGQLVASLVRELCYPGVRRALAPWESRFPDRPTASALGDGMATRCGAIVLGTYAPDLLDAYHRRFGVEASSVGFLSAAGLGPGVAAFEPEMESALLRELNLETDSVGFESRPVGR